MYTYSNIQQKSPRNLPNRLIYDYKILMMTDTLK